MVDMIRQKVSADEFLQMAETMQPSELIDGEIIMSPPPVTLHQRVSRKTLFVLDRAVPNGELFYAPIGVYFDEANILEPDLVWVAENSTCQVGEKTLVGAPDLVVEIFSPGTTRRDRDDKYKLYEKYGVREYWMIDPMELYIEIYVLRDGQFERYGIYGPGETFTSEVLGGKLILIDEMLG